MSYHSSFYFYILQLSVKTGTQPSIPSLIEVEKFLTEVEKNNK